MAGGQGGTEEPAALINGRVFGVAQQLAMCVFGHSFMQEGLWSHAEQL